MNASSLFNDGIHSITSFLSNRDWLSASLTCHRWYNIAAHFEPQREILLSPLTLPSLDWLLTSCSPLCRHVTGLTSVHPEDYHLLRDFKGKTLSKFSKIALIAQKLPQLQVLNLFIKEDPTACKFFSFDQFSTSIGTPDPSPSSVTINTPTVDSNYALIHRFLTGEDFGVSSTQASSSSSSYPPNTTTFYLPHLHILTIRLPFTGSQSAFRLGLNCFLSQLKVSCPKLQYFTLEDESRWKEESTPNVAAIKEIMKTAMQHLRYIKQVELYIPIEPVRTIIYAPANEINATTFRTETHQQLYLPNCILPWTLLSVDLIERLHSVLPGQTHFTIGELLSDPQLKALQRFRLLQTVAITGTENSDPLTPSLIDALSHCPTITRLEFWNHSPSAQVWSQLFTSLPLLTSIYLRPGSENYDLITLLIPFATRIRTLRLMSYGIVLNRRTLRSLKVHFTELRSLTLQDIPFLSDPDEYDVLVTEEERSRLFCVDCAASTTRLKARFNEPWMLPKLEYFAVGRNGNEGIVWNKNSGKNTDNYRV